MKNTPMLRVLMTAALTASLSVPVFAADPAPAAPPAERQSTMLILDGSNSMWGQLKGINKIVTARESIRTLLENAHGSIDFGLLTYGNQRNQNGCDDFTLVSKPQDYDMVNLLKQVYKVKPRGRSPIAESLRQAAKNLPSKNAHILLVSDGVESCGADPCAVAKELLEANPDLQIDVIGFRDEKDAQLECIAENGRGAFVVATDTDRLKTLLAGVQAKAQAMTRTPLDSKALPGSIEIAIRAQGKTEPLRANYSVYLPDGTNVVNFTARTQIREYLQPGTYRIKAIWQNYEHAETLNVQSGKSTPYTFDVGPTGMVNLTAVNKTEKPLQVNYALYTPNGDFIARHIMQNSLHTRLPVGQYRIKATVDDQTQETEVKVSMDNETPHTFRFADK